MEKKFPTRFHIKAMEAAFRMDIFPNIHFREPQKHHRTRIEPLPDHILDHLPHLVDFQTPDLEALLYRRHLLN